MLADFLEKHQLPQQFTHTVEQYYAPLAEQIFEAFKQQNTSYFVGINGCQGSGKSTFTAFIGEYLMSKYSLNVAIISLDDFYLTQKQRKGLAKSIHPLLATRGVPGTHDNALLKETLNHLRQQKTGFSIPQFNKAIDDPFPKSEWTTVDKPIDIILFEGWCWGISPQNPIQLAQPINKLEIQRDQDATWRNYVNTQLTEQLQPLYSFMNTWIVLQAPSFKCVHQWRLEQEQKLAEKTKQKSHSAIMDSVQIMHFIQHFQRLTEHGINTLSQTENTTLFLDETRHITHMSKAL